MLLLQLMRMSCFGGPSKPLRGSRRLPRGGDWLRSRMPNIMRVFRRIEPERMACNLHRPTWSMVRKAKLTNLTKKCRSLPLWASMRPLPGRLFRPAVETSLPQQIVSSRSDRDRGRSCPLIFRIFPQTQKTLYIGSISAALLSLSLSLSVSRSASPILTSLAGWAAAPNLINGQHPSPLHSTSLVLPQHASPSPRVLPQHPHPFRSIARGEVSAAQRTRASKGAQAPPLVRRRR
mmetsp:Transcript_44222/g.94872  ORF Transcript_44222/g.94872 Transcript_44222/m.94872 type:complete len:234 (-) Transcript_44222:16-717(-)